MALTRPIYLDASPEPVEALYSSVERAGPEATAVLICPPWGWDEVASYRSRRDWAQQLAAAGHPTLRFALPATGSSAGSPRDPGRVDAWIGAIDGAATWLRATSGLSVAVLGLGLGGLLAREALARGSRFEELIVWGAPVSGRAFVREMEAFSRMQPWNDAAGGGESGLPEGWLEAGGFVLSRETIESLKGMRPEARSGSAPRRALLLERDGIGVDEGLRGSLEDAGTEVTVAPGDDWGLFVSHAERTRLAAPVGERVEAWLAEGDAAGSDVPPDQTTATGNGGARVVAELDELVLDVDGHAVRESAILVPQQFGHAFGILSEPAEEEAAPFCALFLNAGAVRNIGPNRLWVETARRWAARGVKTLRLDLEGIGESDGAMGRFYSPKFEQQLALIMDRLQAEGLGDSFLLAGLCSGGYWAFREALSNRRVHTLLLLNSGALEWDTALIEQQREAGKLGRASDPGKWRMLLRGEVGFRKIAVLVRALLAGLGRSVARLGGRLARRQPAESSLESALDRLKDSGTTIVLAFSKGESLFEDLDANGTLAQIGRWPNIELTDLPGDDHTLRPIPAQIGARELLDRELERALGAKVCVTRAFSAQVADDDLMLGGDLEVIDGASAGGWIEPRLGGEFGAVTLQVPSGYESYVRVFHPASDSEGNSVRWKEVAEAAGRTAHREMQWGALVGSSDRAGIVGPKPTVDPSLGRMDLSELDAICEILRLHTDEPGHCFFGLCVIERWEDSFAPEELKRPYLKLPLGRDHIVLAGPLSAIDQIVEDWTRLSSGSLQGVRAAPNLIWPRDRTWFLASEVDFDSSLVGGSAALVEAIVEEPRLEAWPVEPDDSLAIDADKINSTEKEDS